MLTAIAATVMHNMQGNGQSAWTIDARIVLRGMRKGHATWTGKVQETILLRAVPISGIQKVAQDLPEVRNNNHARPDASGKVPTMPRSRKENPKRDSGGVSQLRN